MFCSEKMAHPVLHLPSLSLHVPCPPVLRPVFAAWEEVCGHVFESSGHYIRLNLLLASRAPKSEVNSPATSTAASQESWSMAEMALSIVEASSGDK